MQLIQFPATSVIDEKRFADLLYDCYAYNFEQYKADYTSADW